METHPKLGVYFQDSLFMESTRFLSKWRHLERSLPHLTSLLHMWLGYYTFVFVCLMQHGDNVMSYSWT